MDDVERRGLLDEYVKFSDSALLDRAAGGPEDFVAGAYEVLVEEVVARGLGEALRARIDGVEALEEARAVAVDLETVGIFGSRPEAALAQSVLASHGIEGMISGDDCGGYHPWLSAITGGVRLMVPGTDFDRAVEILQTPMVEEGEEG